jgi:2-amino-4-hydroxy-6-hydroxymethyldihydropteridine diphosphokinase
MAEAWIALGSNVGDRREHLRAAVEGLRRLGEVTKVSSLYETEPVGFKEQGAFLNAVLCLQTQLPARGLLEDMLRIEAGRGRVRGERNGPRTLDLDLLFYDDAVIEEAGLVVPHPRLHERRFVLAPLCEVAPRLRHPVLKRSVVGLLEDVQDHAALVRVECCPGWMDEGTRIG